LLSGENSTDAEEQMTRWSRCRSSAPLVILSVVVNACGGAQPSSPASDSSGAEPTSGATTGAIGAPEQPDLTIAIPFSDGSLEQRYFVARAEGYLDEAGLNLEVITADDTRAAVVSGDADIGLEGAGGVIDAIDAGLAIEIFAGHACRQGYSFAVAPGIDDVTDLAGKDIILASEAGDPAGLERKRVLAEAGWDIDGVDVNLVVPGSGDETQFLLAGRVALTYFFPEDRPQLEEFGASFPVDELRPWPNDVYFVRKGWVAENPSTAAQFLIAQMKTLEFITAPAVGEMPENQAEVLDLWRENGFGDEADEVEAANSPYGMGQEEVCPNLYYSEEAWDTTIELDQMDVSVPFDDAVNLDALTAAQTALGLDNSPPEEVPYPPTP
jgi:NitT/TauT family transport system substrate-binding protein